MTCKGLIDNHQYASDQLVVHKLGWQLGTTISDACLNADLSFSGKVEDRQQMENNCGAHKNMWRSLSIFMHILFISLINNRYHEFNQCLISYIIRYFHLQYPGSSPFKITTNLANICIFQIPVIFYISMPPAYCFVLQNWTGRWNNL